MRGKQIAVHSIKKRRRRPESSDVSQNGFERVNVLISDSTAPHNCICSRQALLYISNNSHDLSKRVSCCLWSDARLLQNAFWLIIISVALSCVFGSSVYQHKTSSSVGSHLPGWQTTADKKSAYFDSEKDVLWMKKRQGKICPIAILAFGWRRSRVKEQLVCHIDYLLLIRAKIARNASSSISMGHILPCLFFIQSTSFSEEKYIKS